jgi:hypothetical protein
VTRLTVRVLAVLAALALGLLMVVATPRPASACSCTGVRGRPVDRADAVFTGRVLSEQTVRKPSPGRTDIRFEVSRVYKGTVYREQVVASPHGSDGCGLDFEVGSSWLVFAEDRIEGSGSSQVFRLVTQQCSGNQAGVTAPFSLGSGRAPIEGASDREEQAQVTDSRLTGLLKGAGYVTLGLALLGAVGLAVLWRPGRTPR